MKKKYAVQFLAATAALALLTSCGTSDVSSQETSSKTNLVVSEETSSVEIVSSAEESVSVISALEAGISFDETDLQDAIAGLTDPYVLQGAEDVNYLAGVAYDSALIADMDYDASQVDPETPGEYPITYQVDVNQDAMDSYLGETYDQTLDYSQSQIIRVEIEKTVTVCTPEEATDLADEDQIVLTDNGQMAAKSDGTIPQTENMPTSSTTTGGAVVDAATGDFLTVLPETAAAAPETSPETSPEASPSVSGASSGSTAKPTTSAATTATSTSTTKPTTSTTTGSTTTTKPTTSATTTTKPTTTATATATPTATATAKPTTTTTPTATATPKPTTTTTATPSPSPTTHTHTWVTVAATGHYEQVQTGTQKVQVGTNYYTVGHDWYTVYQCNSCGATFSNEYDVGIHEVFECGGSYSTYEKAGWYEECSEPIYEEQPVYSTVWVEDTAAYEYCSGCGATR